MKLLILFFSILGFYVENIQAQVEDIVLDYSDVMPEFEGGPDAMYRFIGENVKYPANARKHGIMGVVTTKFIVDHEGKIKDIQILKGVHPDLDNEAMRVIALMSEGNHWKPGMHEGQPVSVNFALPIRFALR